jgi:excisionase family DNA binding protein
MEAKNDERRPGRRAGSRNKRIEVTAGLEVLTVRETAEILRIGLSQAYSGIKSGEIPSTKIGGSYRVPLRLLQQMLEAAGRHAAA